MLSLVLESQLASLGIIEIIYKKMIYLDVAELSLLTSKKVKGNSNEKLGREII
ncbi:hypothetical protein PRVXT_000676 [Proteinivorax tanatarense]|uniref:Uncharacterized protein n=1 Tax=Proteinivorax tanatarense TaxID=1260629 RepID=A0AAU7VN69_9FIRM